ncbi:unnamed protein product [Didymodactylos carnosus]|uniref:Uncharacterized protein n=1 Tax=Didymodactylos carnosus TaxID=1234261 RepID=A0A814M4M4_9BILA|nr:unnamed protein product [Didymodactylos carnosus]CAF1372672.1 unnamed protein product [Didymodactylos carnosus]CAF3841060.1 unnamed protein product [Didymodactylos carnosus]CAF4181585.1 unnamed protein product [Didymodactylos carnosus]
MNRSPLGERLKYQDTFRIVTDMNRLNENPSDYEHSERQVKKLLSVTERQFVTITTKKRELFEFVNFI